MAATICSHAGEELWPLEIDPSEDNSPRCHRAPVNTTVTPTLRQALIGPLTTQAGSWTTIWLPFSLLTAGDRILEFVGDAIDLATNKAIAYPPLHLHHIHVSLQQIGAAPKVHWFETHGDYLLTPTDGYNTKLPPGYCVVHPRNSEILIQAQVNDVRFTRESAMSIAPTPRHANGANKAEAGAPPLNWALRILFRLAEQPQPQSQPKCRAASKLLLWHPLNSSSYREHLWRYEVDTAPSVWWWHLASPWDGEVLTPGWLHSHRARYAGIALIDGEVEPLSLSGLEPTACRVKSSMNCSSLAAIRATIVAAAGQRLICADDPTVPSVVRIPWRAGSGVGGSYDRAGQLHCKSGVRLRKGQVLTVVSFSEARWSADVQSFPQHTMIFLYVRRSHEHGEHGVEASSSSVSVMEDVHPTNGYGRWRVEEGRVERLPAYYPPERGAGT